LYKATPGGFFRAHITRNREPGDDISFYPLSHDWTPNFYYGLEHMDGLLHINCSLMFELLFKAFLYVLLDL
jgi:hypothetical protein